MSAVRSRRLRPAAGRPPRGPSSRPAVLRLRQAVNMVTLATPVGLALALAGRARIRSGPYGLLLATGYQCRFPAPRAPAVTVGDVVLLRWGDDRTGRARYEAVLGHEAVLRHEALLRHEARHAAQWACCGGLVGFLPAYLLASAWSWWRTGSWALGNVFEQRAGLRDGGYLPA